jgi:hypothetical protein
MQNVFDRFVVFRFGGFSNPMSILRDDLSDDAFAAAQPAIEAHTRLEAFGALAAAINGLGVQYRQAFRVRICLPVQLTAPARLECETVDLSVLGVRLNRELPCALGTAVGFTADLDGRGVPGPRRLELRAEVVRIHQGDTGLRFIALTQDQRRTVRELVHSQQAELAARRALRHGLSRPGAR